MILSSVNNSRKIASIIAEKISPKSYDEEVGEVEEENYSQVACEMACRAFYSAMQSGDFKSAVNYYEKMHEMIDIKIEAEEPEELED